MAKPKPGGRRPRKRERKNVAVGVCHIKCSFNNTIVSITAQLAAEKAAKLAFEQGMRRVEVHAKGPGSGRDTAIRSLQNTGIEVTGIKDVTPVPHNGCKLPKRKRN